MALPPVALRAGVFKRVAREAGTLLEHRQSRVGAGLERPQRRVTSWKQIVAADAGVRRVAGRARRSIERGMLAVDVVAPAGRVATPAS